MGVNSLSDLQELEARIRQKIKQYELDDFLGTLLLSSENFKPFIIAGMTLFGVRFASPPIRRYPSIRHIPANELNLIAESVSQYLLADPISFHPPVKDQYHGSTLIPVMLRLAGNQLPFAQTFWGQGGRSIYLFKEIPHSLKITSNIFDLNTAFSKLYGVNLDDFLAVGYVAFSAANANRNKKQVGFSRGYFQKARTVGVKLPDDDVVLKVMDKLAADQWQMRDAYEKYKQDDRNYAAYDYNPLFVYPIVRPWVKSSLTTVDEDRLIAPLPEMILTRLSSGVYEELAYKYKSSFPKYFGHIFEQYVGEVLRHCVAPPTLISESEIRRTYSDKRGKAPDWVVIDGDTAIIIECKAVGYPRKAIAMGDATTIDWTINKIAEGLVQMHEFKGACVQKELGLERFYPCTGFRLLLITYEPVYLSNSVHLSKVLERKVISMLIANGLSVSPWVIWSTDEIERLQPHLNSGLSMRSVIDRYNPSDVNESLNQLHAQTGRTFKDSFLIEKEERIFKSLGVGEADLRGRKDH